MVPRINAPVMGCFFVRRNLMDKKKQKILEMLEEKNGISLKSFLVCYCGVRNQMILSKKISHRDIKCLMPNLKRVGFDHVLKNIKEVYIGNIILVRDSYCHYAPYLKPNIMEYNDDYEFYNEYDDKTSNKDEKLGTAILSENLNLYELKQLKDKYKELGRISEYRKVCKIIRGKREDLSVYHATREKIKLKGRLEND